MEITVGPFENPKFPDYGDWAVFQDGRLYSRHFTGEEAAAAAIQARVYEARLKAAREGLDELLARLESEGWGTNAELQYVLREAADRLGF